MKAIRIHNYGRPEVLKHEDAPHPEPQAGEVLVRVDAAGVNPIDRVPDVPGYTELQREMRDAIRAQHPEWVEADGKSARYDYYESLFAALLVSHRAHARASQSRSCRDRDDG